MVAGASCLAGASAQASMPSEMATGIAGHLVRTGAEAGDTAASRLVGAMSEALVDAVRERRPAFMVEAAALNDARMASPAHVVVSVHLVTRPAPRGLVVIAAARLIRAGTSGSLIPAAVEVLPPAAGRPILARAARRLVEALF
jgi:hypothetical protein